MYGMTPMGVFFTAIFPLEINEQALCQQPQFVPKWPAPAADLRRPSVQIDYPPTKNLNGGKYNDNHQSERLLFLVYP